MRRLVLLSAALSLFATTGCKKEEVVQPVQTAPAEPPKPVPPPEPKVELPPAPSIPQAPAHLPPLEDPADNPTTPEKVALGHMLFFDKRMSKDGSMACENCHHIANAYTEGQATSAKVGGGMNKRNAPTMANVGYHSTFYWDGRMPTLEAVSNAAWKGQLGADPAEVAAKLNAIPAYKAHFQRAFGQEATADNVPKALAAFLRALRSGNAPFDKFEAGDASAVSKEAQRGFEVFKSAGCTLCHAPPLYTDGMFHNVGIGFDGPEAERDWGRKVASKDEKDGGKFKTPSLRDVAKTGPYFHDGSVATLDEAIELMAAGGKKNPNLDEKLKPQKLKAKDKAAIKAFLESLSGEYTFAAPPQLPE